MAVPPAGRFSEDRELPSKLDSKQQDPHRFWDALGWIEIQDCEVTEDDTCVTPYSSRDGLCCYSDDMLTAWVHGRGRAD